MILTKLKEKKKIIIHKFNLEKLKQKRRTKLQSDLLLKISKKVNNSYCSLFQNIASKTPSKFRSDIFYLNFKKRPICALRYYLQYIKYKLHLTEMQISTIHYYFEYISHKENETLSK